MKLMKTLSTAASDLVKLGNYVCAVVSQRGREKISKIIILLYRL